jgi:hypothetical protein
MSTIGLVGFQVDLSTLKKQSHQRGTDVKVASADFDFIQHADVYQFV